MATLATLSTFCTAGHTNRTVISPRAMRGFPRDGGPKVAKVAKVAIPLRERPPALFWRTLPSLFGFSVDPAALGPVPGRPPAFDALRQGPTPAGPRRQATPPRLGESRHLCLVYIIDHYATMYLSLCDLSSGYLTELEGRKRSPEGEGPSGAAGERGPSSDVSPGQRTTAWVRLADATLPKDRAEFRQAPWCNAVSGQRTTQAGGRQQAHRSKWREPRGVPAGRSAARETREMRPTRPRL